MHDRGPRIDLRRRRSAKQRELVNDLDELAGFTNERDAKLIRRAIRHPLTIESKSSSHARRLRRRVHRVCERLTSFAASKAIEGPLWLTETQQRLARLRYVEGLSLRAIAREMRRTLWWARRQVDIVDALIRAEYHDTNPEHPFG